MNSIKIKYIIQDSEESKAEVQIDLRSDTLELIPQQEATQPFWAELDYHCCPNCPLALKPGKQCPAALSLQRLVRCCGHLVSHQAVDLQVITPERTINCLTTAQKSVSSLMGLLLATSGCPHTSFLKPMARFHLPLASEEETLYRATSMYLLGQYYVRQHRMNADFDLDGLKQNYNELRHINRGLSERLHSAVKQDSSLNALVLLDLLARFVPFAIEDSLEQFRPLFADYLTHS